MRRDQVTAEVWIAHRKLRKKVASAKWYAQKKKREIKEERQLRHQLETAYQARLEREATERAQHERLQRAYRRAVLDHIYRGYPVRPDCIDPEIWSQWSDVVETHLERAQRESNQLWNHVPWDDLTFLRTLRQMGMRELRSHYRSGCTPSTSSDASLWCCSLPGVIFAGLARHDRHGLHWPWVARWMLQWHHTNHTTVHTPLHPFPVNMPPTQKPNQNIPGNIPRMTSPHHVMDWIQQNAFPPPIPQYPDPEGVDDELPSDLDPDDLPPSLDLITQPDSQSDSSLSWNSDDVDGWIRDAFDPDGSLSGHVGTGHPNGTEIPSSPSF